MIAFFKLITSAFTALPQMVRLWEAVVRLVGDMKTEAFIRDLDRITKMVEESRNEDLDFEVKRKLRQQALKEGSDLWSRSITS